ncbi:MAG: diaminopimelate decarboxylase, partial [Actinobacteria bacterium]|nr:diaminopimelate decarboxylase [Actinomycetota bacterium]
NIELFQIGSALELVQMKSLALIKHLADFSKNNMDLAMVARTHNIPAQVTTMARRSATWMEELLFAIRHLEDLQNRLPLRGIKGPIGTGEDLNDLFGDGYQDIESEIAAAIDYGVGVIVIDSLQEIDRVARIAHEKSVTQGVLLRLNPGVDADTHEAISTGHEDVKFGFSIASGAAWDAILSVKKHDSLELRGLHAHIGSQIFTADSFELSAARLISVLAKYRDKFGAELAELDLGGGYAIAYIEGDKPSSANEILSVIAGRVKTECEKALLKIPRISIEPGRVIVGPAMVTIYKVGTTKEVTLADGTTRWYVSVDGGMSDNIRPALYEAQYSIVLANRSSSAPLRKSRVVGKHCETGDIIIRDVQLPSDISPGDLLVVPATGAYGRSMASNYNHMTRPPVICVLNGKARSIIRRETHRDLLALEIEEEPRQIGKGEQR